MAHAGRLVFSLAVAARRTVGVAGRSRFEPVVKLTGGDFQRRWSATIRRQHALFGYGDRGPGPFGAGPHRELVGQFACLVPDSSILAANRVEVLSVAGRGGDLRLRLVGGAGPAPAPSPARP